MVLQVSAPGSILPTQPPCRPPSKSLWRKERRVVAPPTGHWGLSCWMRGLALVNHRARGFRGKKSRVLSKRFPVTRALYAASHQYFLCLLYTKGLHRPVEEVGAHLLEACCFTNENEGTGRKPCATAMPGPSQACDLLLWKESSKSLSYHSWMRTRLWGTHVSVQNWPSLSLLVLFHNFAPFGFFPKPAFIPIGFI